MTAKICASVTARTNKTLMDMIQKSERTGADMIEIRLDFLTDAPDVKYIRGLTSLPLIATNRLKSEGGLFQDSEEKRVSPLFAAAVEGFEYVDLELAAPMIEAITAKFKKESKVKLIISYHNFQSTPSLTALNRVFKEEIDAGADICKIIPMAERAEDNLTCLRFTAQASKTKSIICFCMGKLGIPSRLFSPLLGGYLTYASVERGKEAASGQLTIDESRRFYELLKS
jgi:3-dehydroquinate dehydratase type I